MKTDIEDLKKKFGKQFLINEKLSNYSWFNLGGPAEVLFKPNSIEDIIFFLEKFKPQKYSKVPQVIWKWAWRWNAYHHAIHRRYWSPRPNRLAAPRRLHRDVGQIFVQTNDWGHWVPSQEQYSTQRHQAIKYDSLKG